MKRIVLLNFAAILSTTIFAQITIYDFQYVGAQFPPTCNPLKETISPFWDDWKLSHGSPSCYSQNNSDVLKLVGKYSSGDFNDKGEGLFINYNFSSSRVYDIRISLSNYSGDPVGYQLYAANGINESSNTECNEEEAPTVSSKELILEEESVYDGLRYKNNWTPNSNYSQLWLKSWQLYYGYNGSFYVDEIMIVDLGPNYPPTVPENLSAENRTSSSISLSWSESSDASGIKNYQISVNNSDSYTTTSDTSYTFNNLSSCTSYSFKVRATDNTDVTSAWSETINASTTSSLPVTASFNTDLSDSVNIVLRAQERIYLLPGFRYCPTASDYLLRTELGGCSSLKSTMNEGDHATEETVQGNDHEHGKIYKLPMLASEDFADVYPNPTTGLINIEIGNYDDNPVSISVYDFSGSEIYNTVAKQSRFSIDLSDKSPGIYLLRIINDNKIIIKRIIKN